MLGNVNRSIDGIYHVIDAKHVSRYLGAFSCRFDRRYQLANLAPASSTPRQTLDRCRTARLLTLHESCM